jgi:hypothetical protein
MNPPLIQDSSSDSVSSLSSPESLKGENRRISKTVRACQVHHANDPCCAPRIKSSNGNHYYLPDCAASSSKNLDASRRLRLASASLGALARFLASIPGFLHATDEAENAAPPSSALPRGRSTFPLQIGISRADVKNNQNQTGPRYLRVPFSASMCFAQLQLARTAGRFGGMLAART